MIFCYRCDNCDMQSSREAPIGKPPEPFACNCGGQFERSYSDEGGKVNTAYQNARNKYPYVSKRLPHNLEGCPTNAKGQPVIVSPRHEAEVMSRHGYSRD